MLAIVALGERLSSCSIIKDSHKDLLYSATQAFWPNVDSVGIQFVLGILCCISTALEGLQYCSVTGTPYKPMACGPTAIKYMP